MPRKSKEYIPYSQEPVKKPFKPLNPNKMPVPVYSYVPFKKNAPGYVAYNPLFGKGTASRALTKFMNKKAPVKTQKGGEIKRRTNRRSTSLTRVGSQQRMKPKRKSVPKKPSSILGTKRSKILKIV